MSKYLPINLFIRQALLYPLTSPFLPPVDKVESGYSYGAGKLVGTLAAAGGLPRTGQIVVQTVNDDGTYQKGHTLERPQVDASRFQDNGDNTITDLATGLMWIKDMTQVGAPFNTIMQWVTGITNCEALSHAGHSDWRMPNINELLSIINYSLGGPAVSPLFTFYNNTGQYWSSTQYSYGPPGGFKWYYTLTTGVTTTADKAFTKWVIPVRLGLP